MTSASVSVRGVSKVFRARRSIVDVVTRREQAGVRAVDNVSFEIARGTTYALVGESGSGKSTIAQLVVGLLTPDTGEISVEGISRTSTRAERAALSRRIQMVFQDPYTSLNPRWRVGTIVAEPYHALGLNVAKTDIPGEVATLLTRVGLSPLDAQKYPHEFSGGQRQRIAIARMLAAKADIVVCDEPTSALDVSVQAQILNLMRDLQDEFALTYLFISHNLAVVRFMADTIGVLHRGRLVESGVAEAIFEAPAHAYTRELLAAVPDPDAIGAAGRGAFPAMDEA